ncbi:MAG: rhomboid family intramembrane serine protease [Spirulina sp.]
MVPLRDNIPTRRAPIVVYGIIALNLVVFLQQLSLSPQALNLFFDQWAMVPDQLSASLRGQIENPLYEWITLLSSQFLHGGFFHIGGNLLYLWIFGNNIEDQLGHLRFLVFYLLCGLLAGLTQWAFDPASMVPTIGASGAIAGVMGAYVRRFPKAEILTLLPLIVVFPVVRISALFFLGLWFAQQAFFSLASLGDQAGLDSSHIAYWAHSGGFVFGLVLGPMFGLMKPTEP